MNSEPVESGLLISGPLPSVFDAETCAPGRRFHGVGRDLNRGAKPVVGPGHDAPVAARAVGADLAAPPPDADRRPEPVAGQRPGVSL